MKNKKIMIIGYIFLIAGIVLIVTASIFLKSQKSVNTSSKKLSKLSPDTLNKIFEITDKKEEQLCKNPDECIYLNPIFNKLKVNKIKNKQVLDFVEKVNINNDIQRTTMKKSSIDTQECASLKDIYYYNLLPNIIYFLYKNDNYLSIVVVRENFNICDKKNESASVDSIFYDLKNDKSLTVDEIKQVFQITDTEILNSINDKLDDKITDLNNYYLYYDDDGKKSVVYLNNNQFINNSIN